MRCTLKLIILICGLILVVHLIQNLTTVPRVSRTKTSIATTISPKPTFLNNQQVEEEEEEEKTLSKHLKTENSQGSLLKKSDVKNGPNLYVEADGYSVSSKAKLPDNPSLKNSNPPAQQPQQQPFSIVTAADSGHFLTLLGAIWALRRTEDMAEVFVYDLGFKSCQRKYLDQLVKCLPNVHVRSFNYKAHPAFFDINGNW
jgi:hypothetical protein